MSDLSSLLTNFQASCATIAPGHRVKVQDFVDAFQRWMGDDKSKWARQEIVEAIDNLIENDIIWQGVVRGKASDNYDSLANIELMSHEYTLNGGKLVRTVL